MHIFFRTEENGLRAIFAHRQPILLQKDGQVQKRPHDVDQLVLREAGVLQLLLLDCPFKGEIVVVAEDVYESVLDAHLVFCVRAEVPSLSSEW